MAKSNEKETSTKTDTTSDVRTPVLKPRETTGDRGNGGGADLRAGVTERSAPEDTGDREAVSPGQVDKIWTNDSKERWGAGQPTIAEQMESQRDIEKKIRDKDK